jgi:hypothetical protein
MTPRKDILESYARARIILYPTVATGDQRFELIANLLDSFENSRQTTDSNLQRKNLAYFKQAHPFLYARLESSLKKEHETAQSHDRKI